MVLGRFGVNTLAGAAGLLDPATEFGLPLEPTDFGVTLASWGANEGPYVEAPSLWPINRPPRGWPHREFRSRSINSAHNWGS